MLNNKKNPFQKKSNSQGEPPPKLNTITDYNNYLQSLPVGEVFTYSATDGANNIKVSKLAWLKQYKYILLTGTLLLAITTGGILVKRNKAVNISNQTPVTNITQTNLTTKPVVLTSDESVAPTSPPPANNPSTPTSKFVSNSPPVIQSGGDNTKTSACGNTNIPDEACMAILSIEKDGVKNNPYVKFDTSKIPSGTKVTFNKSSWTKITPDSNSISGKLVYLTQTYNGTVIFQLQNGIWVANNYFQNT